MEKQMLDRKKIKLEFKLKTHQMGIYKITNTSNGKIFIRSSKNINASSNRFTFGQKIGMCLENELNEDFQKYGANSFKFEIVDILKVKNNPTFDSVKELKLLEEKWLNKLKPFNDNGYNKINKTTN